MFTDWKNKYSENEYTTQRNLQIQCNPYQAMNGIFHRTRKNNFTICETCLTSGYTTKLQSPRQYGTGTKTEIQINGTKQKTQR